MSVYCIISLVKFKVEDSGIHADADNRHINMKSNHYFNGKVF